MIFKILATMTVILPFLMVPNKFDCFRNPKEIFLQMGFMALIGASFFDKRVREYKNEWIYFFLIYMAILYARFFGVAYVWGATANGVRYWSAVNSWTLLPMFNLMLGIVSLKIIIEYLTVKHMRMLLNILCFTTFIVCIHMICQKIGLFQVYGYDQINYRLRTGWLATNRVIGFIGNPMVLGSYIAIVSQFNLILRKRINYIFYIFGFIACCCTVTTSSIFTFLACTFIYLLLYYRKVFYWVMGGSVPITIYLLRTFPVHQVKEFFSSSDRIAIWIKALTAWKKMPYTGAGLGNFKTHRFIEISTTWLQAHSEPIQFLLEIGIIGVGFIAIILWSYFKGAKRYSRDVVVCSLVMFAGVINSFIAFPLHIAPTVFVLMLGFAFKEIIQKEESDGEKDMEHLW